uniref:MP-4 n=1 Tax=Mucuna pruriens TaxID=157652 RepID=A0A158RFS0_MUCPR|nr:Chain B, MP-4 [Mucuna pruriens]
KNDAEPVIDTDGNPLLHRGKYYIMPSNWGPPGGGLRLGKTRNLNCPVTVLQDYNEAINGLPVKFNIREILPRTIFTDTELNIEFTEKPNCAENRAWSLFKGDDRGHKARVGIGGSNGHPGGEMLRGGFYGEQHGLRNGTYKLVFCRDGSSTCLDVGRYGNREGRRLGLSEAGELGVGFEKAGGGN